MIPDAAIGRPMSEYSLNNQSRHTQMYMVSTMHVLFTIPEKCCDQHSKFWLSVRPGQQKKLPDNQSIDAVGRWTTIKKK